VGQFEFCPFVTVTHYLEKRRGTPSVEVKRVRKGLMAKELTSGRCGGKCGRSWK